MCEPLHFFLFFLHLAEETKVFDFFSCIEFCRVVFVCINLFNFIKLADFEGHLMVSDMNEILSFPCKLSYQNADSYVKLTNIKI